MATMTPNRPPNRTASPAAAKARENLHSGSSGSTVPPNHAVNTDSHRRR